MIAAVAGERVLSHLVHHEPTIDERDEVRRHMSVLVLTPSRLILAHTDEHAPDDLLPAPYTSTSTEAVAVSAIRSVVVNRMVANPASYAGKPIPPPGANEAVLTIGWGAVGRIDLEPAGCADPECDADHGYTGVVTSDDFSMRVSAAAEGPDAVADLLDFADVLSASTGGTDARSDEPGPVHRARLRRPFAGRRAARRRGGDRVSTPGSAPPRARAARGAAATWCSSSTASATSCSGTTPRRRRSCTRSSASRPRVGVPSTTATSLTSFGTALPPGTHGVVGFTSRIPGTDDLLNALPVERQGRPARVAAAPHRVRPPGGRRRAHDGGQQARLRDLRADGRRLTAARSSSAPTGSGSGSRRCRRPRGGTPSVTYMYDGDLDWTGHRYGVASPQWEQQLSMIDAAAEHLRETLPASTPRRGRRRPRHGRLRRSTAASTWTTTPDLLDGVVLARRRGAVPARLLPRRAPWTTSPRPGASVLGERAEVLTRDEAIGLGWFGAVDPGVRPAAR